MSRWHNIYLDKVAYFFTASVVEFLPVLRPISVKESIFRACEFYRDEYATKINAYVIMPEHIHLIIRSESGESVRKFMQHSLRKISRGVVAHTQSALSGRATGSEAERRLGVFRMHARGAAVHRVWKERAKGVAIYSHKVMKQKLDYIHANPLRRGLVKDAADYLYSSHRNYYLNDHSIFRIDPVEVMVL